MKTLLERLKPEYKAKLEKHGEQYPLTYESMKTKLSTNYALNLDYDTVMSIDSIFFNYNSKSLRDVYLIFEL